MNLSGSLNCLDINKRVFMLEMKHYPLRTNARAPSIHDDPLERRAARPR
jgi:hypothetical protein